jgi:hypothetical protein
MKLLALNSVDDVVEFLAGGLFLFAGSEGQEANEDE